MQTNYSTSTSSTCPVMRRGSEEVTRDLLHQTFPEKERRLDERRRKKGKLSGSYWKYF